MAIDDMDIPGFRLHPLKGEYKCLWAINMSGNWRVTFRLHESNVYDVNYENYN
ncbi:MAG: type II toxin-antitoxin system RelE/ParE family toxin [Candidatus Neomarinimicrobiota bacterium]